MERFARESTARVGASNVEFRKGLAEQMPVDDGWADVVISNGVINLCPDKEAAYREVFRVLRPGGRIQIVDTAVRTAVPEDAREDIALWAGVVALVMTWLSGLDYARVAPRILGGPKTASSQ